MTIPLDLNLKMAENGRPKPYEQGISSLTRVKRTYNELHNEASPPPNTPFKKHKTYSRFHGSPEYHSPNVRILECMFFFYFFYTPQISMFVNLFYLSIFF